VLVPKRDTGEPPPEGGDVGHAVGTVRRAAPVVGARAGGNVRG
jgi:hypothetical protein